MHEPILVLGERRQVTDAEAAAMKKLYVIRQADTNLHKIGYSHNPENRMRALQAANPHTLSLVWVDQEINPPWLQAEDIEPILHDILADRRVNREWFNVTLEEFHAARDQAYKRRYDESFERLGIM